MNTRRKFLRKMFHMAQFSLAAPLFPYLSPVRAAMPEKKHYIPLNGRSLRELALEKVHHGNPAFHNPLAPPLEGRFWEVLSWKLFHPNAYRQYLNEQPETAITVDWDAVRAHEGVSVTLIKHACVMIKDQDTYYLVDPIFDDIFWFIKDYSKLTYDLSAMPRPDHILITHGHYDHLDLPTLSRFPKDTHVISPLGYRDEFDAVAMANRTTLDWFERYHAGGREITFLPSNHWTLRNPLVGPNRSLWGGYLLRTRNGMTLYISGDTAYFDGYEQLGHDYAIDLAIMNLGAYEPRWFMSRSHMNPAEVVQACQEMKAKKVIIVHWGAYQLGDEPVHFPPQEFKHALEAANMRHQWIDLPLGGTYFTG